MSLRKIKKIVEEYFKSLRVDDVLNDKDVDIYKNPSAKELKEIMADMTDSKRAIRFIMTKDLTTYVWRWDKAIHKSVRYNLGIEDGTVIGGICQLIPYRELAFDMGRVSVNKDNGYTQEEMESMFFSSPLAKTLHMTPEDTKVDYFEYGNTKEYR